MSDTADWVFFAEAPEILLGFSVASAGDVNNDGYADILISAPHYEDTLEHVNEGKAYLFLGSATGPGNQPDWTYQCNSPNSSCGYAVGAAGDVDNDNYDDFLIGAPHYDNPDVNEGAAFLFLGAPDGPADTADWTMEGNQEEAWFGNAVASAGDANGDGFSDVIVGSSHL